MKSQFFSSAEMIGCESSLSPYSRACMLAASVTQHKSVDEEALQKRW